MAYKFQLGKAKLAGSIETAQAITSQGGLIVNGDVDLDAGVINNVELQHSSVQFNGVTVALGAAGSFGTDAVTEGSTNKYYLDSRARAAVSVTDAGGDGSLSYDSATGVVSYTGPSATEARAHFSAGAGLDYDSATGAFSVGSAEVTNSMLAGAIENAKLVNSSVSVVAGGALTGGGTVALGSSITLDVAVNGDALEVTGDAVALKATIAGSRTFSGDVTISGGLTVTGTTTYINTTNLDVADALVKIASGSATFAANQGLQLGDYAELKTALAVADVGNALSSSLPLVAPSMKAASFYGNLVGSMQLSIEAKSANATIAKNITKAMANITLTLPTSPVTGQEHRVKCFVADDSSPAIVIAAQVGATIEGESQVVLQSYGAAVSCVWDGTMWMVF